MGSEKAENPERERALNARMERARQVREAFSVGTDLLDAVQYDRVAEVQNLLQTRPVFGGKRRDIIVNVRDNEGLTPLHRAAALGSRTIVRLLVASGRCNYSIMDEKGRFASDLALEWANDVALARWLRLLQHRYIDSMPVSDRAVVLAKVAASRPRKTKEPVPR